MTVGSLLFAFVTLLAMINPVEAATAFDTLTVGSSPARQKAIALRSTVVAGMILLVFGIAGDALFSALGITLAAFRIAGGLLLLRVAFNMVFAAASATPSDTKSATAEAARDAADPSVFPLAIPIITGPGALTAIVTLFGRTHGSFPYYVALSLVAAVVLAITYATMRASELLTKILGTTGVNAIGRVVGIIVAAIAIQLIIDGAAAISRGAIVA